MQLVFQIILRLDLVLVVMCISVVLVMISILCTPMGPGNRFIPDTTKLIWREMITCRNVECVVSSRVYKCNIGLGFM